MSTKNIEVIFPKVLYSNRKGLVFLGYFWGTMKKHRNKHIIWILSEKLKLDTNLLAFVGHIVESLKAKKNNLSINIVDENNIIKNIISDNHINKLFEFYNCGSKIIHLGYNKFNLFEDDIELENFYQEKLQSLDFQNKKKIITIISELITNVKMHASPNWVFISSYYDLKSKLFKISLFNKGITIKQNIEKNSDYIFKDDVQALKWAIKKSNSTRNIDDTGGLGLYIARKYLAEIGGKFEVASGKGFIIENTNMEFYNLEVENNLEFMCLKSFIPGTLITLNFKSKSYTDRTYKKSFNNIFEEFEKIMEGLKNEYGMYN